MKHELQKAKACHSDILSCKQLDLLRIGQLASFESESPMRLWRLAAPTRLWQLAAMGTLISTQLHWVKLYNNWAGEFSARAERSRDGASNGGNLI